jgi:hypothetical protein
MFCAICGLPVLLLEPFSRAVRDLCLAVMSHLAQRDRFSSPSQDLF